MKAIVIHAPRDLRIEEREPSAPGAGEVGIRIAVGGVCGSDLHYYNHGGFGPVRLKEPMILGHEVSGWVAALGEGVDGLKVGELIAVSPSRPCEACGFCLAGMANHCLEMRFYGSAMPFPHIQGAFREALVAKASQCVVANELTPAKAAMAEPLSVCLHAARRAGDLMGARVLVTGCGPIGVLAIHVACAAGAREIVATDLADAALSHARAAGADLAINAANEMHSLRPFAANKGVFDVMFECSGAPAAVAAGVETVRPGGVIVQLGLGGDMTMPMQAITAKEIELRGSFRFYTEFETAVAMMSAGRIDPGALVTHTMPLGDAEAAFLAANDRCRAMKTQISFE